MLFLVERVTGYPPEIVEQLKPHEMPDAAHRLPLAWRFVEADTPEAAVELCADLLVPYAYFHVTRLIIDVTHIPLKEARKPERGVTPARFNTHYHETGELLPELVRETARRLPE